MLWYFRHDTRALVGSLDAVVSCFPSAQNKKHPVQPANWRASDCIRTTADTYCGDRKCVRDGFGVLIIGQQSHWMTSNVPHSTFDGFRDTNLEVEVMNSSAVRWAGPVWANDCGLSAGLGVFCRVIFTGKTQSSNAAFGD